MSCFRNDYFIQLGPEKGVIHLATAAIVNALWDLWAKMENKVKLHHHKFVNTLVYKLQFALHNIG